MASRAFARDLSDERAVIPLLQRVAFAGCRYNEMLRTVILKLVYQ